MTAPKYIQAAAIVRARIEAGALRPGQPAPSGAELARITGFALLTGRRALRALIADGTLIQGPSPNARPRVAGSEHAVTASEAGHVLSAALARHRLAAGLRQPQLASLIGFSVTAVGHAETGRLWQSRKFWERADMALNAGGVLLRLHDAYLGAAPAGSASPKSGRAAAGATTPSLVVVMLVWDDGTVTTIDPAEAHTLSALDG
jgi:hypothetical protein